MSRLPTHQLTVLTTLIAALAAAMLLSAPRAAQAWQVEGNLTALNQQLVNSSAGAVSGDMTTNGTALRLAFSPDDRLSVGVLWHTFGTDVASYSGFDGYSYGPQFNATADILTVDASYRFKPTRWLRPFLRAGAGVGTTWIDIYQTAQANGRVTAPALAGAGGVEILIPPGVIARGRDFSVGFLLEFGWSHVFSGDLQLDVQRSTTPKTQPRAIAAGSLGWSAFTTRFGLVVRL